MTIREKEAPSPTNTESHARSRELSAPPHAVAPHQASGQPTRSNRQSVGLPRFGGQLRPWVTVSDLIALCPPVSLHSFVWPSAEPFFRPGPHEAAAVARSGGQGRPLGAARRAGP